MSTIFISYRRTDSKHATSRVYDRLRLEFGKGTVFKDVDSIPIGTDFRAVLKKVLGQCRVALVMIGPGWVNTPDADGKPRLMNPTDYVRLELEATLARDIPVVPVLLDGAAMPRAEDLPESLRPICFRHAIVINDDPHFDDDVARLIRGIGNLLDPKPPEEPKPPKREGEDRGASETGSDDEKEARQAEAEPQPAPRGRRIVSGAAWGLLGIQAVLFSVVMLFGLYAVLFARRGLAKDAELVVLFIAVIAATSVTNLIYARGQSFRRRVWVAFLSAGIMILFAILQATIESDYAQAGKPGEFTRLEAEARTVAMAGAAVAGVLQVALTGWFILGRHRRSDGGVNESHPRG